MKNLFRRPFTFKKILLWASTVVLLTGLGFAGRFVYVTFIHPRSSFDSEQIAEPSAKGTVTGETGQPVSEQTQSPDDVLLSQADLDFMKDRVNILVMGIDHSEERDAIRDTFRSDVLMLFSIDFAKHRVNIISVPRDSYSKIYNTDEKWKLNGAFALGGGIEGDGFVYAEKTVSSLMGGIPINYYAAVDMAGLKDLVDAMGGVDYDVDVEINLNGRLLQTGLQHLNGQQVLDYCRARKGISTDVGRTDRQQRMLIEIVKQLKSRDQLKNMLNIYQSIKDKIYTNLNLQQIAALIVFGSKLDLDTSVTRNTLEGEYMTAYGVQFYVLDQSKKAELIKQIFGIKVKAQDQYDIEYVKADIALEKAQEFLTGSNILSADRTSIENIIKSINTEKGNYNAKTMRELTASLEAAIEKARKNAAATPVITPVSTPVSGNSTAPTPAGIIVPNPGT